ncbi:serine hydrolase domain-containing protein [Roseomonas elaeocarpi]|uniref:Serine hydrolase domain-containing protein n=1 Tax=Roseomonas elaeocarpi TaxID=907779 RepID=A0ABV6JTQ6_9PROT
MIFPPHDPAPLPEAPAEALGFDPTRLAELARWAPTQESPFPRDLPGFLQSGHFEPPPGNEILGPVEPRGAPNGLILRHGRVAARWGDTQQADRTFSVAKSCLSILAGIAVLDGLIPDLDAPVSHSVSDAAFAGARNGAVTWRMLLTQTSEWEGTLHGKSDVLDRGRNLQREDAVPKGWERPLATPGTHWEYNDVRVNALSLALLHRFRRPLPEVWAERVQRPIGGSENWSWDGYRTAAVALPDGRTTLSVPGGTHWGGGMRTHAEDQARIGLLMLSGGLWNGQRILPPGWVALSGAPTPLHEDYGLLWWLNRSGRFPEADRESLFAQGAGGNVIWIEPASRIVAVFRWLDPAALPETIARIAAARRI